MHLLSCWDGQLRCKAPHFIALSQSWPDERASPHRYSWLNQWGRGSSRGRGRSKDEGSPLEVGWMNYTCETIVFFLFFRWDVWGKCVFCQYAFQFVWQKLQKKNICIFLQPTFAFLQRRCCCGSSYGTARRLHISKDLTLLGDSRKVEEVCTKGLHLFCPLLTIVNAWDVLWRWLKVLWGK